MESKTLASSFIWKFSERILSQGLGLVIQIIIARMINPEAVGEMAILLSVINLFSIVTQSGFSSYIIQKKNLTNDIISTVTSISILLSVGCILLCLGFGNAIMEFIGYPRLGAFLKVYGFVLLFQSINGICMGLLSRDMKFKEMFLRTLIVLPLSACVCFAFIFADMDLEALIAYNIVNPAFTTVFLLLLLKNEDCKVRLKIDSRLLKEALPYSLRVLGQDVGNALCYSLRNITMGSAYSANDLAFYDRAFTYTSYVEESITYTASSVLLPAMAKVQDDKKLFKEYIVNATALYSIVVIPALLGFAAIAPTFTTVILSDKWMPCVPFMYVFAVGFLHYPILTIHRPAYLACGRSDVTLKISIIQNIISLLMLMITVRISPIWVAIGTSVSLLSYVPLFVFETKKQWGISFADQMGALCKYILLSLIMSFIIYPINSFSLNGILKILLQIFIGIAIYAILLFGLKDKYFMMVLMKICNKLNEKESKS